MDYGDIGNLKWYLIQTKPRKEKLVESNLSRLMIESYSPKIRERRRHNGSYDYVLKPLFPGYIFARFSIVTHYRTIKFMRGVKGIVSFGGVPAVVDNELIRTIRARERDGVIHIHERRWRKGEVLEIVDGPFRSLTGIFERYLNDNERVEILINCIRFSMRVNLRKEYLRSPVMKGNTTY